MQAQEDPLVDAMAGEFAVQSGDFDAAARHYLHAAIASDDPLLAERATQAAMLAGDPVLAQAAMARWAELEPDSRGLLATRAIQAIRAAAIMTPITAKNTVIVLMYSWSCTIAAPTGSDSSSDPDGVRSQNVMK